MSETRAFAPNASSAAGYRPIASLPTSPQSLIPATPPTPASADSAADTGQDSSGGSASAGIGSAGKGSAGKGSAGKGRDGRGSGGRSSLLPPSAALVIALGDGAGEEAGSATAVRVTTVDAAAEEVQAAAVRKSVECMPPAETITFEGALPVEGGGVVGSSAEGSSGQGSGRGEGAPPSSRLSTKEEGAPMPGSSVPLAPYTLHGGGQEGSSSPLVARSGGTPVMRRNSMVRRRHSPGELPPAKSPAQSSAEAPLVARPVGGAAEHFAASHARVVALRSKLNRMDAELDARGKEVCGGCRAHTHCSTLSHRPKPPASPLSPQSPPNITPRLAARGAEQGFAGASPEPAAAGGGAQYVPRSISPSTRALTDSVTAAAAVSLLVPP